MFPEINTIFVAPLKTYPTWRVHSLRQRLKLLYPNRRFERLTLGILNTEH